MTFKFCKFVIIVHDVCSQNTSCEYVVGDNLVVSVLSFKLYKCWRSLSGYQLVHGKHFYQKRYLDNPIALCFHTKGEGEIFRDIFWLYKGTVQVLFSGRKKEIIPESISRSAGHSGLNMKFQPSRGWGSIVVILRLDYCVQPWLKGKKKKKQGKSQYNRTNHSDQIGGDGFCGN